jgi:cell division protein FtsI/penicillin-binding protein 2
MGSLGEQAMLAVLAARSPGDYILVNIATRIVGGSRWDSEAAPVGSLLKPFTALAWGEAHGFRYPEWECRGKDGGCWLAIGHGRIGLRGAIAHSCNAWFRRLASETSPEAVSEVLARHGVKVLPPGVSNDTLIGSGNAWRVHGKALAVAYAELLARRADAGAGAVVDGMARAASEGTAKALGADVLAKTGTAWCSRDAGDGYLLAAFPAAAPRHVVLFRVHGTTGTAAASRVAPVVRELIWPGS